MYGMCQRSININMDLVNIYHHKEKGATFQRDCGAVSAESGNKCLVLLTEFDKVIWPQ